MKTKKLILMADGNPSIGAGHLSRCLTIGRAAKKRGIAPFFILSDKVSLEYLTRLSGGEELPHRIIARDDFLREASADLNYSFGPTGTGLSQGRSARKEPAGRSDGTDEKGFPEGIISAAESAVLVDSYEVSAEFFESLLSAGFQRVAWIDDLHDAVYPGVLIIDYDKDPGLAPVREGFAGHPYEVRSGWDKADPGAWETSLLEETGKEAEASAATEDAGKRAPGRQTASRPRILFSSGSGDPMGLYEKLSRIAKEISPNLELQALRGISSSKMPEFLSGFDVGIFAAGGSLYEAAALGLPLLSFSFADNQIAGAKAMEAAGIRYLGDCREAAEGHPAKEQDSAAAAQFESGERLAEEFWHRALKEAAWLLKDPEARQRISERERSVIDGRGAERILDAVVSYLNKEIGE